MWVVSLLPQRRSGRYGFRPLAGCGLFPSGRCLRHGLSGVSVPLRGVGCFQYGYNKDTDYKSFRPLAGCGLFPSAQESMDIKKVSVPLRGVGCFENRKEEIRVWAVSVPLRGVGCFVQQTNKAVGCKVSVPLRGVGCFYCFHSLFVAGGCFRPLAGCGLFRQSCTFFLVQQEKELSTLLFYCIILADVYQ